MGAVNIYRGVDCTGQSGRFYYNPDDRNGGQYYQGNLGKAGLGDNEAQSIQVPEGYTAYLYKYNGFRDLLETITG